jgi:hypothetical protein
LLSKNTIVPALAEIFVVKIAVRPIGSQSKAGLLIPAVDYEALFIGYRLPIPYPVIWNSALKNQVNVAAERLQRVVLDRTEPEEHLLEGAWREVVSGEELAGVALA